MTSRKSQQGFLMIVAIVLLVVTSFLAVTLSSMVAGNALSGANHFGSMQALFEADSGLEFEQRRWAQNQNWYRSTTDPSSGTAAAQTLGPGSFTVSSNLPATLLRTGLAASAVTINAYTTNRFPASGTLQIEEDLTADAEFVRYTGIVGNTFTGVTRGATVGTIVGAGGAGVGTPHQRSNALYPVTTLVDALVASCAAPATFRIAAHPKFLTAGTLDIENEEISYTGSTVAGGNMTLTGVTRCRDGGAPVAHAVGQPVTPVLTTGISANQQVEMVSTGTLGNNVRYSRRTIQRP